MRDFHVSPAMGTENSSANEELKSVKTDASAIDKFKRIAKLAMDVAKTAESSRA